jgi:hypothetical protein
MRTGGTRGTHSWEGGIISLMIEGDDQNSEILAGPLTSLYLRADNSGQRILRGAAAKKRVFFRYKEVFVLLKIRVSYSSLIL